MNTLEIILILIGIIIIIISSRLVDRSKVTVNQPISRSLSLENSFSEEEIKLVKEKMNKLLSDVSEETVIRTDDSLSKLSNEKILAVNEFSEQILEKIKRNHEEVVFLYSMLGDKEKELKAAVREIDSSKKKVQDIIESRKEIEKSQLAAKKTIATQTVAQTSQPVQGLKPGVSDNKETQRKTEPVPIAQNGLNTNNNTQILSLFSQGKSVVEISKLLGIGQGEVKLVIDLFRGKK